MHMATSLEESKPKMKWSDIAHKPSFFDGTGGELDGWLQTVKVWFDGVVADHDIVLSDRQKVDFAGSCFRGQALRALRDHRHSSWRISLGCLPNSTAQDFRWRRRS